MGKPDLEPGSRPGRPSPGDLLAFPPRCLTDQGGEPVGGRKDSLSEAAESRSQMIFPRMLQVKRKRLMEQHKVG